MKKDEKWLEYAGAITALAGEMFDEDSEHCVDLDDLSEGDNLTHFIHALANVMPTVIYNKLTNDDKNNLEFNHLANRLCFQYSDKVN